MMIAGKSKLFLFFIFLCGHDFVGIFFLKVKAAISF